MDIDEAMRHRIHGQFETLLGHEEAAAIMSKLMDTELEHSLELFRAEVTTAIADLGSALRTEMNQQFRFMLQWMTGSIFAAGSLGLAAGRLLAG